MHSTSFPRPIRWRARFRKTFHDIKAFLLKDTTIAIFMALVAMFGMVTAYRTATAEEDASVKESKLTQSRFLELTEREELLDRTSDRGRFERASGEHLRRAKECLERADKVRASDRGRAALFEVEAQEEYSLARIHEPYLAFTEVEGMSKKELTLEQVIDQAVSSTLADSELGSKFEAKTSSIWKSLEDQIGQSRNRLLNLALAVVIFVVALGFLSLAELWRRRRFSMLTATALGAVATAAAITFAAMKDHSSLWYYAACFLGFGLVWPVSKRMCKPLQHVSNILATKLAFMTTKEAKAAEESESPHPPETDVRQFVGVRVHAEHVKSPFTCLVVLLIVLAVLLSAGVSYLYSKASVLAGQSAGNAIENLNNGLKRSHTTSVYFELGVFASLEERRARYQASLQQVELSRDPAIGIDSRSADENRNDAKAQLDDTDKGEFEMLDGEGGPEHDRHYPRQWVLERTTFGPECGFALADAGNEQDLGWRKRAHWYLAGITMFAIALYLFGQSLSMGRSEEAWTLVFFGLIVVAVGIGLVGIQSVRKISSVAYDADACSANNATSKDPALRAAVQYAFGVTDFQLQDYKSAVDELEEAVKARPKFLFANLYLSLAAKELGNPQEGEGFLNLIPEERISEAVIHQRTALEGFAKDGLEESPVLLGNYGFDAYLYGLMKKDRAWLKRGIESTQEAIKHDKAGEELYLQYNLAVAELASGNMETGLAKFAETAKNEGMKGRGNLVAGAVGDLEALFHYCEGLNSGDYCKQLRSKEAAITLELAAAAWPPSKTSTNAKKKIELRNISILVAPSGLRWEAQPVNFNPDDGDATLAVLWYTREPGTDMWRVLSKVSGKVNGKDVVQGPDGKIHQFRSYLEATDQEACLPAGDYRADFYLNGVPFYVTSKPLDAPSSMRASPFRDMNLSLCRPKTWTRWRPSSLDDPVLAGGYEDKKDHPTQGIFLFDYYYPKTMWDANRAKDFVSRARTYLAAKGIMTPGEFLNEQNVCAVFPKDQAVIRQASRSTGETFVARVWPAKEGIVHVALGYNRTSDGTKPSESTDPLGNDGIECNSLRSVREIYNLVP